jgi:hypothetical protein
MLLHYDVDRGISQCRTSDMSFFGCVLHNVHGQAVLTVSGNEDRALLLPASVFTEAVIYVVLCHSQYTRPASVNDDETGILTANNNCLIEFNFKIICAMYQHHHVLSVKLIGT